VVGQSKAQQKGVGAQMLFEVVDDGDGTTFANQDGFVAKGRSQGAQGSLGLRTGRGDQIWLGAMATFDFQPGGRRAEIEHVASGRTNNFARVLVGNEAHGQLGAGPGGDNGFAAFALITAGKSVDFNGR